MSDPNASQPCPPARGLPSSADVMISDMYCVLQHNGGDVLAEFFKEEVHALACFAKLSHDCSCMVIAPDGSELKYSGLRAGRDEEMREWLRLHLGCNPEDEIYTALSRVAAQAPVFLSVYDVVDHQGLVRLNNVLRVAGSGAYHAAVEINGQEYSFGGFPPDEDIPPDETGVFVSEPRQCHFGNFRESLFMGRTELSEEAFEALIAQLSQEWVGISYDLLGRNCCHFSDALCKELGVGAIPRWLLQLAGAGKVVADTAGAAMSTANDAISEGKSSRGVGDGDGYKFGDLTRGFVQKGKRVRSADVSGGYQFGDLTRGVMSVFRG